MSTKDRKDCELCLNHGFKTDFTTDHQMNCRFIQCKCDKCSHFVVINEDNKIVLRKFNSIVKTVNNKKWTHIKKNIDKSSQTNFPPRDPLEAVKTFADHLSNIDISETNLRTCVLYALLKNNEFSIEETKRKLFEARTAITESLVLPLKRIKNLNINCSGKRSFSSLESISISIGNEDLLTPEKKLCLESKQFKARKSFPNSGKISINDSNLSKITKTQPIYVSTGSPSPKRVTKSSVQTHEQILQKCDLKSPTNVALNSPKNIAPKPVVSIQTKPNYTSNASLSLLSTSSNTRNVETIALPQTMSNTNINSNLSTTYLLPIYPLMNLQSGTTPTFIQLPYGVPYTPPIPKSSPQVITTPKTTYTSTTIGSVGSLGGLNSSKTVAKSIIKVSPSINSYNSNKTANDCALKGIKINCITKVPPIGINNDKMTNVSTVRKPEIKTYSRIQSNEMSNNSNKLCAKIITSEAALAALSAISNISSSNDAQSQVNNMSQTCETSEEDNNQIEENEEYILPDENMTSTDDSNSNAGNTYVINTSENPMDANVNQSNNEISFLSTSKMPKNDSLLSQNSGQKSSQAPRSLRVQKLTNKKLMESQNYFSQVISGFKNKETSSSPNFIFAQNNNNDKNIVHITIDD